MGARQQLKMARELLARKRGQRIAVKRVLDRLAMDYEPVNQFCNRWGAVACELAQRLDVEGVPLDDERRVLKVEDSDLARLRDAGCNYQKIYGLRIVT